MGRDETIAYTGNEQQQHKLCPVGNLRKGFGQEKSVKRMKMRMWDSCMTKSKNNFYKKCGSRDHA